MVLGELGLILEYEDAAGVQGWLADDLTHEVFVGLGEPLFSSFRISSFPDPSVSPSIREDANVLKSLPLRGLSEVFLICVLSR